MLSRLAGEYKVVFVSPPFYIVDVLHDAGKGALPVSGTRQINPNFYVHVPPKWLPYNLRYPFLNRMCAAGRRLLLKKLLRGIGAEEVILFIWHPRFHEEIGRFGEKQIVYYMHDDFSGYVSSPGEKNAVLEMERIILNCAHKVIANGDVIYRKAVARHGDVLNSPSAVDYEFFQSTLQRYKEPDDMKGAPRPRVGYVGVINRKVDFELLYWLAKRNRGISFVLVGPVILQDEADRVLVGKLKLLHNVFFLGTKTVSQVPNYINALDVGLMSYRINDWTKSGYPLKLHEYLACGKPSVASPLDTLQPFKDVVRLPVCFEQWEQYILESLAEPPLTDMVQKRKMIARQNSWDQRISEILEFIDKRII